MKRFIMYFLYTLLLGFVLIIGTHYGLRLKEFTSETYNLYPYIFFTIVYPVILGILLALPQFAKNCKKEGVWHFDWIKLVSIGLPTLYLSLLPLLFFSPIGKYFSTVFNFISHSSIPQTVSGIVLGYLILSVPEKHSPE